MVLILLPLQKKNDLNKGNFVIVYFNPELYLMNQTSF